MTFCCRVPHLQPSDGNFCNTLIDWLRWLIERGPVAGNLRRRGWPSYGVSFIALRQKHELNFWSNIAKQTFNIIIQYKYHVILILSLVHHCTLQAQRSGSHQILGLESDLRSNARKARIRRKLFQMNDTSSPNANDILSQPHGI
jgi:hypothetical protein